jgi:murein DD-endopeptidase MepM/ murein hydrolase activator NlpD
LPFARALANRKAETKQMPLFYNKDQYYKSISKSQIIRRISGLAFAFILLTSFTPGLAWSSAPVDYGIVSAEMNTTLLSDSSGFLIPVNPQTGSVDRSNFSDKAIHVVRDGENLSLIAASYNLKTNTLLWENGLSASSTIKVGQNLIVPPVDGVSHTVAKGQSIEKIASLYNVKSEAIIKQNSFVEDETLISGESVFVPGAKPLPKPIIASIPRTTESRTYAPTRVPLESTTASAALGKFSIYPTRGKITQGYYSWHRAVDIADRSKPPIWAAAGGTVIKASSGSWGGGYGNHVIIDQGNGIQTLYAHLDYLSVSNNQYVNQGEVIGRMGNTGRVYGVTGIHLHFEVRDNGVKAVPSNYW